MQVLLEVRIPLLDCLSDTLILAEKVVLARTIKLPDFLLYVL